MKISEEMMIWPVLPYGEWCHDCDELMRNCRCAYLPEEPSDYRPSDYDIGEYQDDDAEPEAGRGGEE